MGAVYSVKTAAVATPLEPHQQRLLDKLRASHGVLAAWGLGSGKTLGALAGAEQEGRPVDVVAPASILGHYPEQMEAHLGRPLPDVRLRSYEKAVREGGIDPARTVIVDEAHRMRTSGTGAHALARQMQRAKARLLLTGTPVFNAPADLAPLLNAAAGRDVVPSDPRQFQQAFVGKKTVSPPFWQRLLGAQPAEVPSLQNREALIRAATGYVDVHPGGGMGFPTRVDKTVDVPMTSEQADIYRFHEGQLPWYLRLKIRANLPLTKQESKELNAFSTAIRQTSNTPRPYVEGMSEEQELAHAPKIRAAAGRIQEMHRADPNYRGLVFSNYLQAGLEPMSRALTQAGVPHALFHGGLPKSERARLVEQYNRGEVPELLLSPAGGEGLDLKGTKLMQVLESHFNDEKINQAIGRAIRYKSHEHLPEDERQVLVERYRATHPKNFLHRLGIGKPPTAIDQFLQNRSEEKTLLSRQIMDALAEASAKGPLKEKPMKTANLSLLRQIQGVRAGEEPDTIEATTPAGHSLSLPYGDEHVRARTRQLGRSEFVERAQAELQRRLREADEEAAKTQASFSYRHPRVTHGLGGGALGAMIGVPLGMGASAIGGPKAGLAALLGSMGMGATAGAAFAPKPKAPPFSYAPRGDEAEGLFYARPPHEKLQERLDLLEELLREHGSSVDDLRDEVRSRPYWE